MPNSEDTELDTMLDEWLAARRAKVPNLPEIRRTKVQLVSALAIAVKDFMAEQSDEPQVAQHQAANQVFDFSEALKLRRRKVETTGLDDVSETDDSA
jgi:hypothetical protein